jgi:hypothetical protein
MYGRCTQQLPLVTFTGTQVKCSIIFGPGRGGNCCAQCFLECILKAVSSYMFDFLVYELFLDVVKDHSLLDSRSFGR